MKNPGFTPDQVNWICSQIGDWYLIWKRNIANFEEKTHSLGFAKEQLKTMICDQPHDRNYYENIDNYE